MSRKKQPQPRQMQRLDRRYLARQIAIRTGTDPDVSDWIIRKAPNPFRIDARVGDYRVVTRGTQIEFIEFEGGRTPSYDWVD